MGTVVGSTAVEQDAKVSLRLSQQLLERLERIRLAIERGNPSGFKYPASAALRLVIVRGIEVLEKELRGRRPAR